MKRNLLKFKSKSSSLVSPRFTHDSLSREDAEKPALVHCFVKKEIIWLNAWPTT